MCISKWIEKGETEGKSKKWKEKGVKILERLYEGGNEKNENRGGKEVKGK